MTSHVKTNSVVPKKRYLAITPARDEARLLPGLIASMATQTLLPARWIVINDGSTDSTAEIINEAARRHSWIESHHLESNHPREPGGESVIMRFLPREVWEQYDFILRLDADLTFEPDMVESLVAEFVRDSALGIVGPTLYEPSRRGWREIRMPSFHTRGAAKMYSRECFRAIGGLEAGSGWDTIDEARAMMLGLKTRSFRHIVANHYRPQGSSASLLHGRLNAGRAAYRVGYSPFFMIARALWRLGGWPPVIGSLFLLTGYFEGYLYGSERAASPDLIRFIRGQQLRRLLMLESDWR